MSNIPNELSLHRKWLEDNGYLVVPRPLFRQTCLVPGLSVRAMRLDGAFVLYDPFDDEDGFLLVGDKEPDLITQAWRHLAGDDPSVDWPATTLAYPRVFNADKLKLAKSLACYCSDGGDQTLSRVDFLRAVVSRIEDDLEAGTQ